MSETGRPTPALNDSPLLRIRGLKTHFTGAEGTARAVDGLDLDVEEGKTVGLVGESGCGKTVAALSVLRLVPPPGRIAGGEVLFAGRDLLKLDEKAMRAVRGRRISMIFQEPMTSLNPVLTVGSQIAEALRLHLGLSRREARARSIDLLRRVRMPAPEMRAGEYPHQLSGGMRQRVMIAMALACGPSLLIADEPTTALDVTVQAQIIDLLLDLQEELGLSILFITHDLRLLAEIAGEIAVMYAARIVERGSAAEIIERPLHPYTRGLLACLPGRRGEGSEARDEQWAPSLAGAVPDPLRLPSGCRFHPRCPLAEERCRREDPPLRLSSSGRAVACHLAELETRDERAEEDER
ncbi:MAG: ABC transporter ATP-binding protein [Planctomycetes bacterium]|nr:ABC transporter ATP-binding protein [Planctomycetota bacterium]